MADVLDFNTAGRQQTAQDRTDAFRAAEARKETIKAVLNANAEAFVFELLPNARFDKSGARVGSLNGERGESMWIGTSGGDVGVWRDHEANKQGPDFLSLYAAVHGLDIRYDFKTILDELEQRWVGAPDRPKPKYEAPPHKPQQLPPPTARWTYLDADGAPIATVSRFDMPDGKKTFRVWNDIERKGGQPDPKPLYNIPGIYDAAHVVFVEGEKCADALIALGYAATSLMSGANSPLTKTDWTPLKRPGVTVTLWPDADRPGQEWRDKLTEHLMEMGAVVRHITPPEGVPEGWDAADALAAGMNVGAMIENAPQFAAREKPSPSGALVLADWTADRFTGEPPPVRWLCAGSIPLGVPALVASAGGIGKSFLSLDFAYNVALGLNLGSPQRFLGGEIVEHGKAVVITAEDSAASVHRRLASIDHNKMLSHIGDRLSVVPLPDAGGPKPLIMGDKGDIRTTDHFAALYDQLAAMSGLKLVVFDPLQAFVTADVTADPAAGQFMWTALAAICSATGATVLVTHHMRKDGLTKVSTATAAREAIRGSTAIVDGARLAYALWDAPEDEAVAHSAALGIEHKPNTIVLGGVVKANDQADRSTHVYVRDGHGLLIDRTLDIPSERRAATQEKRSITTGEMRSTLLEIDRRWKANNPFARTYHGGDRYIVPWICRAHNVKRNTAESYLGDWINNGLVQEDVADGHSKMKGLKVTKKGQNELRSNCGATAEQGSNHV